MKSTRAEEFVRNLKEVHQRRKELWWKLYGDMLYSRAFQAISRDRGPTVPVLLHCIAKQSVPPSQKERKRLRKAGLPLENAPQPFSFPVREAEHIGLSIKALWKGLERLHETGFIDRLHAGSAAKKGDYATYQMSDRWKKYGEKHFKRLLWEKAQSIGTRDITIMDAGGNVVHQGTGRFIKRRIPKTTRKVPVVAPTATTEGELMAADATTDHVLVAADAINSTQNDPSLVAADATVLHNHISLSSMVKHSEGNEKKVLDPEVDHGRGATNQPKTYHPPKAEIRENVAEILRQRPDHRADDRRFLSLIVDHLDDARRGRLDPGCVHRDLQDRHGLDDWTADILSTISTLYPPMHKEARR